MKSSPHACFLQCYLFRLDVYYNGVFVECLAEGAGIGSSRSRAFEDRLFGCVTIRGEDRAKQAIRFAGTFGGPTERTEQVVVYKRPVEVRVLKTGIRVLCLF
ncbi:hypothetical protein F4X88_07270 [Candidatus Poribacteria bacterium]|nr:hypothetical protein [Candidatus Poribacteria bacterium]